MGGCTVSKYALYPYDGKGNIRDSDWHYLWDKLVEEGLVDVVFCNNRIANLDSFIALIKTTLPIVVLDTETNKPLAMAWLADVTRSLGFGHFVFFKETWGTSVPHDVGKDVLKFWFNTLNLDLVLGVVPAFNTHAIEYVESLGMAMLGTIPHLVEVGGDNAPGVLGYITKEMFNG
jgi:RimJ/RimL family protein N-acetyltransferase